MNYIRSLRTIRFSKSVSYRVSTIPTHTTPLRLTAIDFQLFFNCPLWKMTIHASGDFITLSVKLSLDNGKMSRKRSSGSNEYDISSSLLSWQTITEGILQKITNNNTNCIDILFFKSAVAWRAKAWLDTWDRKSETKTKPEDGLFCTCFECNKHGKGTVHTRS